MWERPEYLNWYSTTVKEKGLSSPLPVFEEAIFVSYWRHMSNYISAKSLYNCKPVRIQSVLFPFVALHDLCITLKCCLWLFLRWCRSESMANWQDKCWNQTCWTALVHKRHTIFVYGNRETSTALRYMTDGDMSNFHSAPSLFDKWSCGAELMIMRCAFLWSSG